MPTDKRIAECNIAQREIGGAEGGKDEGPETESGVGLMTKTQEITAAQFHQRFVAGQEDPLSAAEHAVAENFAARLEDGHVLENIADRLMGKGDSKRSRRHPTSSTKQPRKQKLCGDVPGSKILENRDVRDPIIDFLQVHGWFVFKHWQGTSYCYPGIPDIEAVRDGVVVYIECKVPGKGLRADQVRFRDDWVAHGGRWVLAKRLEDVEWMAKRGGEK